MKRISTGAIVCIGYALFAVYLLWAQHVDKIQEFNERQLMRGFTNQPGRSTIRFPRYYFTMPEETLYCFDIAASTTVTYCNPAPPPEIQRKDYARYLRTYHLAEASE